MANENPSRIKVYEPTWKGILTSKDPAPIYANYKIVLRETVDEIQRFFGSFLITNLALLQFCILLERY